MMWLDRLVSGILKSSLRSRVIAFFIFAHCVMLVSLVFFGLSAAKPYMGVVLSMGEQGWTVQELEPNGQAVQAGMNIGDKPVQINSQPAEVFLEKYRQTGTVYGLLIRDLTVVDNAGSLKSVSLADVRPSWRTMSELPAKLFVCVIFWITGFYVFFKRPTNRAALLLCLCSLTIGLSFSANAAAERVVPAALEVELITSVIGPWLLFHFFLALPEERTKLQELIPVYIIYLPAAITLVLLPFFGITDGQPQRAFQIIRFVEYGVAFLGAVGVMIYNYVRVGTVRTKQQMKIVLIGALAALIPSVLVVVLPAAIWKQNLLPYGLDIIFFSFIPLGMGYAIISQKLMNIDIIIRRGLVYGLVTFIMAAIMSAAILILGTFKGEIDTPQQIIIALGLGIIATALFGPIKKGIEMLLDRFFYKDRYDYRQTIQSLSNSLKTLRDFPEISRFIVATVSDALNLAGACLYVKGRTAFLDLGAAQGIFTDGERQIELTSILTPSQRNSLVEFPNPATGVTPDLAFIISLVAGDREVGVLCLSEKVSRQQFSSNDLYLLQGISSVAAIALRSASLMQDVSMRNTFVSIASHELNTPLTSVIGYSELLLKRNLQPNEQRWAKQIFDSGRRIATIVDDLLDVTRIQSGRVVLKLDKVKLEVIFAEHLTMARETSNAHEFIVDISSDVPEVYVDRDKFGQVIWNLLSNAIKYSPNGGRITIAARYNPENFRVVVSVADQGMGIGPADRDSLFTTFHRIKRPETVSIKGAGLGLYIVKQWTEVMGGQVWLESELNKGSTFFVAVPTANTRDKTLPQR